MRNELRVTGICQDRDVHVDVYRGSVFAQYGNRYVIAAMYYINYIRSLHARPLYDNLVNNVIKRTTHQKRNLKQEFIKSSHFNKLTN